MKRNITILATLLVTFGVCLPAMADGRLFQKPSYFTKDIKDTAVNDRNLTIEYFHASYDIESILKDNDLIGKDARLSNIRAEGYTIRLLMPINNHWGVVTRYSGINDEYKIKVDGASEKINYGAKDFEVGVEYHTPLTETVSFTGGVSIARSEYEITDYGYLSYVNSNLITLGLTGKPNKSIEYGAGITYSRARNLDKDADKNDVEYRASARYFFTPNVSTALKVAQSDYATVTSIDFKFNF